MEIKRHEQKLTQLFEKFTQPGYVLNSYFADHLLTHLGSKDEQDFGYKLSQSPRIMKMFVTMLENIEKCTPSVQNFLVNLAAIRARSDFQFAVLTCDKGLTILDSFLIRGNGLNQPSMKIAFLNLLMNLPDHSSGISWLIENEWWRAALKICSEQQTVYVTRAAYQFLSKFLWKLSELDDEANCLKILDTILEPLKKKYYNETTIIPTENDGELTKSVMPVLLILHELHRDPTKYMHHTVIARLFHYHFGLGFLLIGLYELTRDQKVLLYIVNIEFMSRIAKRFINKKADYALTQDDVLEQCLLYFNIIHRLNVKRCAGIILQFSIDCITFWNKIGTKEILAFERNGKTYSLETQLVIVSMIPILSNIKCTGNHRNVEKAVSFFDMYMAKMVDMASEHTTRVVYQFRDLISEENSKSISINAINLLYSIRKQLDTAQASMVYQSLFYMLQAVVPIDDQGNLVLNINMFDSHEDVNLMLSALNLIHDLVKDHDLNWHVSYEVICLFNCMMNILKMSHLPMKIIMQVLRICMLAIERFLPPNLALLMETKDGSVLDELGDVIFAKMHDVNWEVRDCAMELLLVCTDIAFMKYPSFQKILLRKNLSAIAVTIALNDSELYVRCTALETVASCIRVPALYNNVLEMYPNLPRLVISLLSDSHEGLLRKNLVLLIRSMCHHERFEEALMPSICQKMAAAALDDLNWEVQLASLRFWKCTIKEHLSHQGMIDGKFPSVTFSKKERKIVTLTKVEIQKRLVLLLNQISEFGCLKVLLGILEGEHEIEVVELALKIVDNLLELLTLYDIDKIEQGLSSTNITGEDIELIEAQTNSVRYSNHMLPDFEIVKDPINVKMETEDGAEVKPRTESDDVIESILDTDDIKLLANIYAKHLTVGSHEPDQNGEAMSEDVKYKSLFTCPKIFLQKVRNTDYKKIIDGRKEWNVDLRNLNSLMDDILGVYENQDVNNLDCY